MTRRNNIPSVPALAEFLDNAFQQHPASLGEHQVKIIFQELVAEYPEIIIFPHFWEIFNAKISTEEKADKIIEWKRSHTRTTIEDMGEEITKWRQTHQGRGERHRGMAKDWQLFLDVENILFFPQAIEKKFKVSIQKWNLYSDLRLLYKALERNLAPTLIPPEHFEAVSWSYRRLQELQKQFYLLFDPNDSKHLHALLIFYDLDQHLPLPLAKGRQVTPDSIKRGVYEVIRYLHQKSKRTRKNKGKPENIRRTEDFYKHKKLYYLTLMFSFADQLIFQGEIFLALSSIIKQKLLDTSISLMRFIPFNDRCTVIQELDEASKRLLPF